MKEIVSSIVHLSKISPIFFQRYLTTAELMLHSSGKNYCKINISTDIIRYSVKDFLSNSKNI